MRTVLIVDDHPSFRAAARAALDGTGFRVVGEAENGTEALEAVGRLQPDVIVVDVQLPDMEGFDVAETLCGGSHRPRIVLVSSRDRADYGSVVTTCGACAFIPKAELSAERLAFALQ